MSCGARKSSSGGIPPRPRRRSRRALSLAEREEISRQLAQKVSARAIARLLKRAPSTISGEIERHGGRIPYRAASADAAAWRRAHRPKRCRLAQHPALRSVVAEKLVAAWAPQQIAGWLVSAYPNDPTMRVPSVEDRAVLGHWEGDLLAGAKNSHIATLVERSKGLMASLTWDRGMEMAQHQLFSVVTDVQVYFCEATVASTG